MVEREQSDLTTQRFLKVKDFVPASFSFNILGFPGLKKK